MKKCYLYETLGSVNEMKVETSNGLMTLSGVFGQCGVRNRNSRVYEKSNYAAMVADMQKRIAEDGGVPGELEHPSGMNITLENISHKITGINIDKDGLVTGTIQLLNTPKGKIAQSIVEGGLPLFVSSRAMGQVDSQGNVKLESLATYDLVGTPGFQNARVNLKESQMFESLGDSACMIIEQNDIEDMDQNEMQEQLKSLQEQLDELKKDYKDLSVRNTELEISLNEKKDVNIQALADGIEQWIVKEYSPALEKWITKEYTPIVENWLNTEFTNRVVDESRKDFAENISPIVQKWVVEEFGGALEGWITEHYSKQIENWVVENLAPGVQSWVIDQFAPEVENWLNESYQVKISDMVKESLKDSKDNKLKSISETLSLLEGINVTKPTFGGHTIAESTDPMYLQSMPEVLRPKYNMAPEMVKESIARRARISDLSTQEKINEFWNKIDFDNITPAQNVYEGLEGVENERERAIRAAFRRKKQMI